MFCPTSFRKKYGYSLQEKTGRHWNTLATILPKKRWKVSKIKYLWLISRHYLALNIAQELTGMLNGVIQVNGTVGGATFTISFCLDKQFKKCKL